MAKKSRAPEITSELEQLLGEYVVGTRRALAALKGDRRGRKLRGRALERFLKEDRNVARIVRRTRKLQDY
jgi:hypothetical protein